MGSDSGDSICHPGIHALMEAIRACEIMNELGVPRAGHSSFCCGLHSHQERQYTIDVNYKTALLHAGHSSLPATMLASQLHMPACAWLFGWPDPTRIMTASPERHDPALLEPRLRAAAP